MISMETLCSLHFVSVTRVLVSLVNLEVVFGLVYMYVKKHQKNHTSNPEMIAKINKVFGVILVLVALSTPYSIFKDAAFPMVAYLVITVLAAILIGLSIVAITIIDSSQGINKLKGMLGYLMLIVISVVPAISIIQYDSSYNALGMAYYTAILVCIFSWWGISLFTKESE